MRIYRIRCQVLPFLTGFVYLVFRPNLPTILIDAGSGEGSCFSDILAGFETIKTEFEPSFNEKVDIQRIILTHTHIDHFGGVHDLKRLTNAEVWVHVYESRIVCSYNERATVSHQMFKQYLRENGVHPNDIEPILNAFGFLPGRVRSTPVDHVLRGGETIDSMKFLHLPGHSCGHLAILIDNCLFSGDLILSKTLTQIWPETLIPHTGLTHYLYSINQLDELAHHFEKEEKNLVIFPGHEEVIENVVRRIEIIRKSVERRNQSLLDILVRSENGLNIHEISKKMYLTSHINRTFFALCDVGCRVEYLQQNGKITVANYDQLDCMAYPVYLFQNCQ
ncbi:MAG: MBL fold metallo-hydrolase [Planctomycetia bacterium]|nr:MBL fold metallo-hydrolase [Planctomycetia bacterium]